MNTPILQIKNLTKTYPSGVTALRGLNLEIKSGEFLVVIGLSGSGKSTLLRSLNRLLDPTSGEIYFEGGRIDQLQGAAVRRVRRDVAMIFQNFNLVPRLSTASNVMAGRLPYNSLWRSLLGMFSQTDRAIVQQNLQMVGLLDKARVRVDQLSGGQQQRVAIARALSQQPKVLLADEPVASLDPATAHTIMDYLRHANRELGVTIVCSLHFLSLVREYATRVVALRDGQIVFEGEPKEIDSNWFKKIYGEQARDIRVE